MLFLVLETLIELVECLEEAFTHGSHEEDLPCVFISRLFYPRNEMLDMTEGELDQHLQVVQGERVLVGKVCRVSLGK